MQNPILDDETEVLTRDFFNYLANSEIVRSMRYQCFTTLLILEPDKDIENRMSLKALAHILREEFRETDIIGRLNGARFGVILPHADLPSSITAGERIRTRITEYLFPEGEKKTISLGLACFPTNVTTGDNFVHLAEQMLEMAKNKGGNNLCFKE